MNAACLARLRQLEAQLVPRHDDGEEREAVIDEILEEVARHVDPDRPEASEAAITAIEAIIEERLAARGWGR
jgi:hypothetical protein